MCFLLKLIIIARNLLAWKTKTKNNLAIHSVTVTPKSPLNSNSLEMKSLTCSLLYRILYFILVVAAVVVVHWHCYNKFPQSNPLVPCTARNTIYLHSTLRVTNHLDYYAPPDSIWAPCKQKEMDAPYPVHLRREHDSMRYKWNLLQSFDYYQNFIIVFIAYY